MSIDIKDAIAAYKHLEKLKKYIEKTEAASPFKARSCGQALWMERCEHQLLKDCILQDLKVVKND